MTTREDNLMTSGSGASSQVIVQDRAEIDARHDAEAMARRGDWYYIGGCIICGTWVLGPIGVALLLYGMVLLRRAQLRGVEIRPWAVTLIGGFVLVDSSVNFLAWGLDLFPAHGTFLGKSVWTGYGHLVDGGYMFGYNTSPVGGVADPGEKSIQMAMVLMAMPMKGAAAYGFLKMKQWGLQWMLISYWMYFLLWMIYLPNYMLQFPLRAGGSDFGVLGFWLLVNVPFLGPLCLLPYLHTVRRDRWTK
jgi:hypothetical protein